MTWLRLEPIFQSPIAMIALCVIVLVAPWIIPVSGRSITQTQRRSLQWLRTITGLVLLLAVLRPSIVRTDSVPTEATIVVLLDRSRSMTLPANDTQTRSQLQNEIFGLLRPTIESLDESLTFKTITYDADANEVAVTEQFEETLAKDPSGNATDISGSLNSAIQSASGRPLAGVVLLGDGVEVLPASQDRSKQSIDSQAGARTLASLDVPLWTVAIGPPGDLGQVRDAEIAELAESYSLFSGNESMIDFVLRTRALTGKAIDIRVTMTGEENGSASEEIAIRSVTPNQSEESIAISLPIVAPEPGRYQMKVSVDAQEGETLLSNNFQIAFVDVREGGGRVLYLEGQPRLEQSYLLQSLRRFPDLQLTYRWIAADTRSRWPIDLGLTQSSNAFDVIIIGDLPAAAIGSTQLQAIAKRVGEGAALLMIGGLNTFAAGDYQNSPLAAVLPVTLDPTQADFNEDIRLTLTKQHPITSLASSNSLEDQVAFWKSLPPLIGGNQFDDLRVAPGIDVLLETADSDPMLVVGEFGGGRVAAFAGDSTWRWVRQGKGLEHRRFWRQLLLWLLNRDTDLSQSLQIELPKRRVEAGQPLAYRVSRTVEGEAGASNAEAPVLSVVNEVHGVEQVITPDVVVQGIETEAPALEGELTELPPGMYRFRAQLPGNDETMTEKSFQILDQDAELRRPFADHTYLMQLSNQTAAAGGAMFLPDAVDELIDLIKQLRRNAQSPVVKKHRLGDTSASAWPLFALLTGLLSTEWYLRRRWGLA